MKRVSKYLIILVVGILFSLGGCAESEKEKAPDPNRTSENCRYFGTTNVYGTGHQMVTYCTPDGDGWYNPAFGHHHHK